MILSTWPNLVFYYIWKGTFFLVYVHITSRWWKSLWGWKKNKQKQSAVRTATEQFEIQNHIKNQLKPSCRLIHNKLLHSSQFKPYSWQSSVLTNTICDVDNQGLIVQVLTKESALYCKMLFCLNFMIGLWFASSGNVIKLSWVNVKYQNEYALFNITSFF